MSERQTAEAPLHAWLVTAALLLSLFVLSGCNTVSGFGRDVESAGETLSDTAEDVQD